MNIAEKSLHYLVEKWLAPSSAVQIRVVGFGRMRGKGGRFVHVEASAHSGRHAMFFFRHEDGRWCVFPPRTARPSMTAYRFAA